MTLRDEQEREQQRHYDTIVEGYAQHYHDYWSQQYRDRFIHRPLFDQLVLQGMEVLEAMCGTGGTTAFLLERGARVTGLDISEQQVRRFKKHWPECEARCASIFSTGLDSSRFDCVVVVGGLHHLHPHTSEGVREIWRVLKTGGYLCFMEPHKSSLVDRARKFWYRRDSLFAENEAAIDVEELKREFSREFTFVKEHYGGNVAYLLVLNSMVFRLPLGLKPFYAPLLLPLESAVDRLQGRLLSCFAVCQWQKQ